jgi:hypothetical protein
MAVWDRETEHEASYKVADFLYYGTAGYQDLKESFAILK